MYSFQIAGTADQAVAEAVVIQVMKKGEEVEEIKSEGRPILLFLRQVFFYSVFMFGD